MKKLWKQNKVLVVLAFIILIALVAMLVGLFTYFYKRNVSVYGNRLNGIENHPIEEKLDEKIKGLFESGVESVKTDVRGKIIYVIMDVAKDTPKDTAKGYAQTALSSISEDTINFYDIQFMMTCTSEDKEEKEYPVLGYKNSSFQTISWTNN